MTAPLAPAGRGVLAGGDFDFVAALVRDRAAIVLGEGKSYLVESRLTPVARSEGLPSVAALVSVLRSVSHGPLADAVVEAMTTNETYFFRDVHPFQALERQILPELMRRRAASRTLTFWCAACSSGQEPYSVALLLRQVRSVLREDGYLFLGGTETTVGVDDTFRRELMGTTPCYRPEPLTTMEPER